MDIVGLVGGYTNVGLGCCKIVIVAVAVQIHFFFVAHVEVLLIVLLNLVELLDWAGAKVGPGVALSVTGIEETVDHLAIDFEGLSAGMLHLLRSLIVRILQIDPGKVDISSGMVSWAVSKSVSWVNDPVLGVVRFESASEEWTVCLHGASVCSCKHVRIVPCPLWLSEGFE